LAIWFAPRPWTVPAVQKARALRHFCDAPSKHHHSFPSHKYLPPFLVPAQSICAPHSSKLLQSTRISPKTSYTSTTSTCLTVLSPLSVPSPLEVLVTTCTLLVETQSSLRRRLSVSSTCQKGPLTWTNNHRRCRQRSETCQGRLPWRRQGSQEGRRGGLRGRPINSSAIRMLHKILSPSSIANSS
jgi:hypothetical protein